MDSPPAAHSPRQPVKISSWEWAPAVVAALLAGLFFYAAPESGLRRFAFWVGLSLVPGVLWRLAGKSSWGVHRIFFALGLIAFVLANPELRPDAATLSRMARNWELIGIGMLISFTQPLWGMLRLHLLLVDSGVPIRPWESFRLCLIGSFFNVFLPGATGGDAYRVFAVTRDFNKKLGPAIASISLDRLLGLPSLILVVLIGMALDFRFFLTNRHLYRLVPFIGGAGVVCLVLVVYLALASRSRRQGGWTRRMEGEADAKPGFLHRIHRMIATNVKRKATLPLALFYGLLSHLACILSCLFFGLALGVEGVPPLRYFLIVPMAMTINAIPGAPGGVGQGELAMATLLEMASPGEANAQAGVMVMLLFRLSNLAIGLAGGILYAMGKKMGQGWTARPSVESDGD